MHLGRIRSNQHLVLLPGLDGTGALFTPFIAQFPTPSPITVVPYPMDQHIPFEQLDDYIIPFLPANTPLIILGESYSGPVALKLAARGDLNVHGVILVATFAKYPLSLLKFFSKLVPLSLLFRLPIPNFVIQRYCFGDTKNKLLNSLLRNAVRSNKPMVLAQRAHDGSDMDVTELLIKIKVPCLYIAASHDKFVPSKAIDYLKKHLFNVEVVTIQGTHFILQVQPKICCNAVNKFLCQLATTA